MNTYKHTFLLILLHLSFSTVSCILVALHITYQAEESNSIRPFNFIADTLAVTILLAVEKKKVEDGEAVGKGSLFSSSALTLRKRLGEV